MSADVDRRHVLQRLRSHIPTLFFFAAAGTEVFSASRRIATIRSSVNRLFFLEEDPFFQQLMVRGTRARQRRSPWGRQAISASFPRRKCAGVWSPSIASACMSGWTTRRA